MPIYEYQCSVCGHQLEALQKMTDEPLTVCPECKQPGLNKLVSAAGFQLKGSGWYMTDYSNKGKAKQPDKSEKSTETSASKEEPAKTKSSNDASSSSSGTATGDKS